MGALCSRPRAEEQSAAVGRTEQRTAMGPIASPPADAAGASCEHPAVAAWRNNSFGVGLSGAGFLMPYHIGAMEVLVEQGIVDRSTHIACASAGTLVATSYKCGLSFDQQMQNFLEVAHICRKHGVHKRLRPLVKAQLIKYLPDNAHELVNGTIHVAISRPMPRLRNKLFNSFHDSTDLRKALLASCHLPLLSDGWLFTRFRRKLAFDGGLTNAVPIVPGLQFTARISALPGHCQHEYPAMLKFPSREELAAAPGLTSPWQYTMQETNNKAFFPQDDAFLHDMRRRGREDITTWLKSVGFPAVLAAGRAAPAKATQPTMVPWESHCVVMQSSSFGDEDTREVGLEDPEASGSILDLNPEGGGTTVLPGTDAAASGAGVLGSAGHKASSEADSAAAGTRRKLERCTTRQASEQLERARQEGAAEEVGQDEAAALEAETSTVGRAGQEDLIRRVSQQAA